MNLEPLIREYLSQPDSKNSDVDVLHRFHEWVMSRDDVENLLPAERIPDGAIEIPVPGLTAEMDEYLGYEEMDAASAYEEDGQY